MTASAIAPAGDAEAPDGAALRLMTSRPTTEGAAPAATGQRHARSDEELARQGSAGIEELFRRHNVALYRFCLGLTRNPDEAADAMQTVWERALLTFSKRSGTVLKVRPWLFTVARNECIDRSRSRGAGETVDVDDVQLTAGHTPQDAIDQKAELEVLVGDIAGLSERQRSAIVLREFAGLEAEELADRLSTSPSRALGLVSEARRTLVARRSGRGLPCSTVQSELKRMRRRSAGVQAHLDSCGGCRSFEVRRRGRSLSSLGIAPLLFFRDLPARLASILPGKAMISTALVAGSAAFTMLPPEQHPHRADKPAPAAAFAADTAPARASATISVRGGARSRGMQETPAGAPTAAGAPATRADAATSPPVAPETAAPAPAVRAPAGERPSSHGSPAAVTLPAAPVTVAVDVPAVDTTPVQAPVDPALTTIRDAGATAKSTIESATAKLVRALPTSP